MVKFQPGQDVIVEFDGIEHRAEVLEHKHGTVMALMQIDTLNDYGSGTDRLAPQQTVCVAETRVRPTQQCVTPTQPENMP